MSKISAKDGYMTIGGTRCEISDWTWDSSADLPDATDSATAANFKSHVVGRKSATVSVKGFLDPAAVSPQNVTLAPGTAVSTVHLLVNGTNKYVIASATVKTMKVMAPIGAGDPVTFEGELLVNGSWTEFA